jgi:DNA-binding CsgD family transcriptional regulator
MLWERDADIAAVTTLLADAAEGRHGALFIVGDAGLGKTALLDAARQKAADQGFLAGSGRGGPMEMSVPFGLIIQAFTELGGEAVLAGGEATPVADATGARFYDALRWLRSLGPRPVVITLDDLHWADADSLALLSFLCRRLRSLPVSVICTLRSWPAAAQQVATALTAEHVAGVRRLEALSEPSSTAVLSAGIGREVSAAEARSAWQLSAGNPLLLKQLAVMLDAGMSIPGGSGAGSGLRPAEVLLARFAGLPPAGMRFAQAAAVVGVRFRPSFVLRLAQLDGRDADEALEALTRSGLLADAGDGAQRFTHPLFRQAVYDDLGGARRTGLHARAFTLLADGGLDMEAAEQAIHGALSDEPRAVSLLERVGSAALRGGAARTAASILDVAAGFAGQGATPGLLIALADALAFVGRVTEAVDACERVLSRDDLDDRTRADALRALARTLLYTGAYPAASQRFTESAALSRDVDPAFTVRTFLAHGWAGWFSVGAGEAYRVLSAARDATAGYGPELRRKIDAAWGLAALETGNPVGLELARDAAFGIAADPTAITDDLASAWSALTTYSSAAKYTERLAEADHLLRLATSTAERIGAVEAEVSARIALTDVLVRTLRVEEALTWAERVASLSDLVPPAGPFGDVARSLALLLAGQVGESEARGLAAEPAVELFRSWSAQLWLWYTRGWRLVAEGNFEEAASVYADMEAVTRKVGLAEPCAVPWAGHAIAAYLGCGRTADAERVIGWLEDCAGRLPCRWPRIAAATGRARLAEAARDLAAADRWHREAVSLLEGVDLPLERVQALLEYGRFLRRSGQPARARAPLALAERVASDGGALWLAGQAADELKVAGGRRRRRTEPERLTPQEQRIADLAVARLTNKEIADQLFLSVKTVETHLGSIYAKLGVRSRRDLQQQP